MAIMRFGRCYKCSKVAFFTKKRKVMCPDCHKASLYTSIGTFPKRAIETGYTTYTMRVQRRKVIKRLGRCQLCGATENLTAHHIGGSTELGLTCLCQTCHRAYEQWQHRRNTQKIKIWYGTGDKTSRQMANGHAMSFSS